MMRAHVIDAGKVVNTIEVESLDVFPGLVDAALGGAIGDLWNGTQFMTPIPGGAIPQAVTMRQARRALYAAGLLDSVPVVIAEIPDLSQRKAAEIDWEWSQEVQRNWPLIAILGPALGLTDAEIDQLFITAATL